MRKLSAWFYLIEGDKVVIEVGDERFTLRPAIPY
jgi:hypothetical protein